MKKNKFLCIIVTLTILLLGGCSHRVLDFTLISSKNVDLTKGASFERGKSRVSGNDMVHWIIIVPTGTVSIKEALDRAIESTPGCVALLNDVIYTKFWWIPYIYAQQEASIEGTPLIDPSLAKNSSDIPRYGKIELDRNGDIKNSENISFTEYFALKDKIVKNSKEMKFQTTSELN